MIDWYKLAETELLFHINAEGAILKIIWGHQFIVPCLTSKDSYSRDKRNNRIAPHIKRSLTNVKTFFKVQVLFKKENRTENFIIYILQNKDDNI